MRTIKTFLLVLSVVLLASCGKTVNADTEKTVEKNIGVQLYSLRDVLHGGDSIVSIVEKLGDMGYKYVETANYWAEGGQIYGMTPEAFKALLEKNGMFALSAHVGHDIGGNAEKSIEDALAWWDKCIIDHKMAGLKYLVTPAMPTPETLEALQVYCDYYNAIGEKCKAEGMKFGYHNHAYEFEKKYEVEGGEISMYDYMVQNTNPELVHFQLDVYWSQKGERKASELFEQYPGRFETLHIKDEMEVAGGEAFTDFEDVFSNVEKAGTKYLIVEVERYNFPPVESVKQSLEYLNNAEFVKADYAK